MTGKTIWKFPFEIRDTITCQMPIGARVLCVDVQRGIPCLWVLVSPGEIDMIYSFELRGTGQPFKGNEGRYVSSFMMRDGVLVFHLFEQIELPEASQEGEG